MALSDREAHMAGIERPDPKPLKKYILAYDKSKTNPKTSQQILIEIIQFILDNGGDPKKRPVESTIIFESEEEFDFWQGLIMNPENLKGIYLVYFQINYDYSLEPLGKENTTLEPSFSLLVADMKDK